MYLGVVYKYIKYIVQNYTNVIYSGYLRGIAQVNSMIDISVKSI